MNLFKPLRPQQAAQHWDPYFQKLIQKNRQRANLQIKVYSQKLGIDYNFPSDSDHQSYHIASIGKVFTATLVQMLAEKSMLSIQDPISRFFSQAELQHLFVYKTIDYAQQVTIEHLLGHTSGIADYFEGKIDGSRSSFTDQILSNPHEHWTPQKLIDFTRQHQKAVGIPGTIFNYSDTGYILLGLIIEKVTGKSFGQNLEDEFFRPLEMKDSYLLFYTEPQNTPKKPIEKIWFNDVEISSFESLSCDWAGGGIISTTHDLLKFYQALRSGRLIQNDTLRPMQVCTHKFNQGIYYGLGMMEIRFQEFFFLLGSLPKVTGHIGILATHLFYDPVKDAYIIMNFGSNTHMVDSFKALIEIESVLQRIA